MKSKMDPAEKSSQLNKKQRNILENKKYQWILKECEKGRKNQYLNNRSFKEYRKMGTEEINKSIKELFFLWKKMDTKRVQRGNTN